MLPLLRQFSAASFCPFTATFPFALAAHAYEYGSQWRARAGDFANDEHTGEVIYAYTMDSCADPNFWCQNDPDHLDLSTEYLSGLGLIGEHFNARIGEWRYMDGVAPGCALSAQSHSATLAMHHTSARNLSHDLRASCFVYVLPWHVYIPHQRQILGRCKHCTRTYDPNK